MSSKIKKLLFIDTNIWLDFYRARTEAGLALLKHAEKVSEKIIVTYQLELEFKKNRQAAILEGMQELKVPGQVGRPGIFSDAKAAEKLGKSMKDAEKQVGRLRARLLKTLENPTSHDPVYQVCQRIFHHREDGIVLTRDNALRHQVRRLAFRRFLHGCPPRKRGDTSFGDSFNWEWMIHCAMAEKAELVIVSRDSDYGATYDGRAFVNDHLVQEFKDRVSQKREILLYTKLSEALKHFEVPISEPEEQAEKELVEMAQKEPEDQAPESASRTGNLAEFIKLVAQYMNTPRPPSSTEP